MTTVDQLIEAKGEVVHTVPDEASVFEAISKMAAEDVGAIVVLRDGSPCGIFTERDYLRRIALKGLSPKSTLMREAMSSELVTVHPDTDVRVCAALMTRQRMRHLPVLEETNLVGLISIGDIVKHLARESEIEMDELRHYIRGS
jgi:CBS domain-containing protein